MILDLIDAGIFLLGTVFGFFLTDTVLRKKKERKEIQTIFDEKSATVTEVIKRPSKTELTPIDKPVEEKIPTSFRELVDYLRDKYMLLNLTLATTEGLPIESNSPTPEEDAAVIPEMFRMLKRIVDSDKYIISSKGEKILIFQVNPDVLAHARVSRDLTYIEIEKLKKDINDHLEVLI